MLRVLMMFVVAVACMPKRMSPDEHRAAMAETFGHPTRKSARELQAMIERFTKDYSLVKTSTGRLDEARAITFEAVRNTCYTFVLRLGQGARWGAAAEAGVEVMFHSQNGKSSSGPGLIGPGIVAGTCADEDGAHTMTIEGNYEEAADALGHGQVITELWSRTLTGADLERRRLAREREDAERAQFAEQQRITREQAQLRREQEHQRDSAVCEKCNARYQGCIGAGGSSRSCESQFRSCTLENAGASQLAPCRKPDH